MAEMRVQRQNTNEKKKKTTKKKKKCAKKKQKMTRLKTGEKGDKKKSTFLQPLLTSTQANKKKNRLHVFSTIPF